VTELLPEARAASPEPFRTADGVAGADELGVVRDALGRHTESLELAARHLDPSLVDMLSIIGFDRSYTNAAGSNLYDAEGRAYLDFHTGEGFASVGHNHPAIRQALQATLAAGLCDGVQIHFSPLAGMLAEELTARLPAGLEAVFFANSGAEAVDSAMKFARAATGRPRLLACQSGFHGISLGPLSLVGDEFFKEGFGPLLPGCSTIPFGDLDRLERELRSERVAAFIVEPIQGRTVALPAEGYLREAQALCRRFGTLFVLDEIQTGLGRTGRWFALEHWDLEPDFVLVGKALSGGYMPVAAMVTRREIHDRAVGTLERSYIHQSTYGRNQLAMAAGLATLRLIERDGLVGRAAELGETLRRGLVELQARHELIGDVRGSGMMLGFELGPPASPLARLSWEFIHRASEGLFPQLIVIPLHREHGIITMAAGKNDVIKLLPPLTLAERDAQRFLEALDAVLTDSRQAHGKNWRVISDIGKATLRTRGSRVASAPLARARGRAVDPALGSVCLVTGASGFIGSHLVERLLQEGNQVRCLARASSDTSRLEELGVEIAVGDLTDGGSLQEAARDCRQVFHCGALVSDWATSQAIRATNVSGTRSLLRAAAAAGARRFIHFSSTDVYGYPGTPQVSESQDPGGFANWYAQSKREAEAEVLRAGVEQGLETVILRPATVYGPRSVEVVGEIAREIRAGRMVLVDRGRAVAGLLYVGNLIDAALLAAQAERAAGEAFNVTDGLPVTWREFTDALAAGLGCRPVRWSMPYRVAHGLGFTLEHGYRLVHRATRLTTSPLLSRQAVHVLGRPQDFSNAKARELLGWEPRVGYAAGLQATLQWLRDEHLADPAAA
jgi:ornithine--oxo-acid transaminase